VDGIKSFQKAQIRPACFGGGWVSLKDREKSHPWGGRVIVCPNGAVAHSYRISMKRVITYGTLDLLHYGHINLLRRAKQLGDYLKAFKL